MLNKTNNMFKADVYFKYDGHKLVDIINIQIIIRSKKEWHFSGESLITWDEYNVIYLDGDGKIKTDLVTGLDDITIIN